MTKHTMIGGLLLLAGLSVALAGDPQPTYKTPQAAFDAGRKAFKNKDWKGVCAVLTDDSRDTFAGMMAFMPLMSRGIAEALLEFAPKDQREQLRAKIKTKFKPLDDVLAKHGLTEGVLKKMGQQSKEKKQLDLNDPKNAAAMKVMLKKFVAPVKDRNAFLAELMAAMEKAGFEDKGSPLPEDAQLKDLEIDGDRAKGVVVSKRGDMEVRLPIEFRRVGGSWRLEMPLPVFRTPKGPKEDPPRIKL